MSRLGGVKVDWFSSESIGRRVAIQDARLGNIEYLRPDTTVWTLTVPLKSPRYPSEPLCTVLVWDQNDRDSGRKTPGIVV